MKVHCESCGFDGNIWRGLVPPKGKNLVCPLCGWLIFIPGADADDAAIHEGISDSPDLSPEGLAWPSDQKKREEKTLPLFDGLPMTPRIEDGKGETDGIAPETAADAPVLVVVESGIGGTAVDAGRASLVTPEPEGVEAPSIETQDVRTPPAIKRLIGALAGPLGDVGWWASALPGKMRRSVSEGMKKTVTMRSFLLVAVVVGLSFFVIGYLVNLVGAKMEREALSEEYREQADVNDEEMDYIKAAEHYAVSIYIDPTNYKTLNNMASMYLQIHRYDDAIELLDEAITIIGTDDVAVSYANRGLAYLGLGDHDRALEDLNTAVAILPDLSYAYTARGFCYLAMEEYEKALAEFKTACDLGDRNGCLLYNEHSADIDE
jgi:hypothetical protein